MDSSGTNYSEYPSDLGSNDQEKPPSGSSDPENSTNWQSNAGDLEAMRKAARPAEEAFVEARQWSGPDKQSVSVLPTDPESWALSEDIDRFLAELDMDPPSEAIKKIIARWADDLDEDQPDDSVNPETIPDNSVKQSETSPGRQNDGRGSDNPVNSKRVVSVFRDAEYMRYLKTFFDRFHSSTRRLQ